MKLQITSTAIAEFQNRIYDYFNKNKRVFPWRQTTNPYHIFVSEVMLQQTQANRVIAKYNEFIQAFPDFAALSKASLRDIYVVWQGMGYNRRAKYLKDSATIIVEKYGGKLPHDIVLLDELPGIGYNTACSIAAFAFNLPVVFIETNIRSVFIHDFFTPPLSSRAKSRDLGRKAVSKYASLDSSPLPTTGDQSDNEIHDKDILPLVEQTLDHTNPREWYWALMDYGSYLKKTVVNPSRKSKHYAKQSTFKGSDRELRGNILRLVSERSYKEKELTQKFNDDRVPIIIKALCKEGLLHKKRNVLYMAL